MTILAHARATVAALLVGASSLMSQPVVRSYARGAQAPAHWNVGPRPALEIGGRDGVGPAEFSGIVGVTRQRDGTLVVADGTSRELRVFGANGDHLRTPTRRGLGPGETEYLSGFSAVADTLVIFDGRRAVHVFAPDGKWLRSLILPPVPGYIVNPAIGALNATDIVVNLTRGDIDNTATARRDSIWLGRISMRDVSVRIVGAQPRAPAYATRPDMRPIYPVVFAPTPLTAIHGGRICLGYPVRYEIACVDSLGKPIFTIRRDVPLRAVRESDRTAYRARVRTLPNRPGFSDAQRERSLAATQFAATFPAFSQLLLARTGELWVRAYVPEDGVRSTLGRGNAVASDWSIYDRQGHWIADCRLPPRFAPVEVAADYVVGVSRDMDDVERVTVWTMRR